MDDKLLLVLGLGNPGPAYRMTRHNVGHWVIELLARRARVALAAGPRTDPPAAWARASIGGRELVLANTLTFMNEAGRAAAALCRRHAVPPQELAVVHDDADLELGTLRIRRGGGAGGHNGLRSLFGELAETDFVRVRLGVRGAGRDAADLADYVLSPFGEDELPVATALAEAATRAIETLVEAGLVAAMNRHNGRAADPAAGP